jgi:hypothetical protein
MMEENNLILRVMYRLGGIAVLFWIVFLILIVCSIRCHISSVLLGLYCGLLRPGLAADNMYRKAAQNGACPS